MPPLFDNQNELHIYMQICLPANLPADSTKLVK